LLLYHTSTNEIYTLSLHDALPISEEVFHDEHEHHRGDDQEDEADHHRHEDFVVKWRIAGHFDRYSRREGSLRNGTDNDRFDCKGFVRRQPLVDEDVPEEGLRVGNELLPHVGGEAVNDCLDFCPRARDYSAVGLCNHVCNGGRRTDRIDTADLLLENEEVGKEFRVRDIPRMDQENVGVLHVAVAVGVKDNPLGSVLVHVLVRDRIGRNCPHEHYCHDGEGDHRYENCSWKPVHDAS